MSTRPSDWATWFDLWSDRVNPAVVKDVRQGLRTRGFWISFGLILLACLAISIGAYLMLRDNDLTDGRAVLIAYLLGISTVQFFILPFSAYQSMLRERNDASWALLTLTGLGARRILHGKLLAFMLQATLYASAAVPFLLFCYYLNGVDVLTLVAILVLGTAWSMFLLTTSLFTAAMAFGGAQDRSVDALTGFLTIAGLLVGAPMGFGMVFGISKLLAGDPGSFLPGLAAWTWGIVGCGLLALELGVDFVSRNNERDARGGKYIGPVLTLCTSVAGFVVWLVIRV